MMYTVSLHHKHPSFTGLSKIKNEIEMFPITDRNQKKLLKRSEITLIQPVKFKIRSFKMWARQGLNVRPIDHELLDPPSISTADVL